MDADRRSHRAVGDPVDVPAAETPAGAFAVLARGDPDRRAGDHGVFGEASGQHMERPGGTAVIMQIGALAG
jgi:hypothetical protein